MAFIQRLRAQGAHFGNFDSELAIPSGRSLEQNAWLTLIVRVYFNFIDPGNGSDIRVVIRDGKSYVSDNDWMFPMVPWGDKKREFQDYFLSHGEKAWNCKITLQTPANYAGLDIGNLGLPGIFGNTLRPNILCLLRLYPAVSRDPPAAHKVINAYRIDPRATKKIKVETKDSRVVKVDWDTTQPVVKPDSWDFRSDAWHYDSFDTIIPPTPVNTYHDPICGCVVKVMHDTIAHEVGHLLGQSHIRGLQGDPDYALGGKKENDAEAYTSSPDNVMGRGNQVWPINAISWQRRIAQHTGTDPNSWWATMDYPSPQLLKK
jgi:hypothetical protein